MPIGKFVGDDKDQLKSSLKSRGNDIIWRLADEEAAQIRFLTEPSEFFEYSEHYDETITEGTRYIPCIGRDEGCPYCLDGVRSSKRWMANVVDLSQRAVRAIVMPQTVVEILHKRWDSRAGTIMDCPWTIERDGSGMDTKYNTQREAPAKFNASRYRDNMFDLEELAQDVVDRANGGSDDPPWEKDGRKKKSGKKAMPPKKQARQFRDEDDDEDDDDEDDDETPPRRPIKKSGGKVAKPSMKRKPMKSLRRR